MASATAIAPARGIACATKAGRAAVRAARAADIAGTEGILVAQRLREQRKAEEFVAHLIIPARTGHILTSTQVQITSQIWWPHGPTA